MATENDWLTHNLRERLRNKNADLQVKFNIPKYRKLNFDEATKEVAEKLYALNNKLFVGLSGGIDSEYVFRRLTKLNIPFKPVIVYSTCYKEESSIAFDICKEYSVNPTVINIDEKDIIFRHKTQVHDVINSFGIGSIPALVMAEYARENDGIYIKGEHMVGDMENKVCTEINEWDFYTDVLYPGYTYDFFLHTPEIVYSMVSEMCNTPDENSQQFKCRLYNIPYRDKITLKLSPLTLEWFRWLKTNKERIPEYSWRMNASEFLKRNF